MKKSIFKKWWFWVILILVLGGIGAALGEEENIEQKPDTVAVNKNDDNKESESEPEESEPEESELEEPESEEVVYQIGDSFTTGNLGVVIEEVEEKKELKSDNQFIDNVTTEGKLILITAKLTNNDKESRTFSSMQFRIIDDKEREFETYNDMNVMMILGDKDLFLKSCNPGMSRTGIFVFEVPEDVESYSLKVYSGVGFAAKTSEIVKLK